MPDVTAIRSVDLIVTDLARAEAFYTEAWGLTVADRRPGSPHGSLYLRATGDDHHILALHEGAAPALRSTTFRAASRDALNAIEAATRDAGGRVLATLAPLDEPGGGDAVTIQDSWGRIWRVVHGDARRTADAPVIDRPCRLSHVNVNATETDATAAFLDSVLGLRLSDRSKLMAFVRCNADHHCVVVADAPVNGLNHVAFMMPGWEGVMRGGGRLADHGTPIGWGVGRHGPGDNVFAYFVDPFGIVVEYTAEVLQVDDTYPVRGPADWTWPPGRTDQWGIAPPKSDAVKRAQLAIPYAPWPTAREGA